MTGNTTAEANMRDQGSASHAYARITAGALLWLVAFLVSAGCASTVKDGAEPRPRDGIAEYRKITAESAKAMRAALHSLVTVSVQTNRCSSKVLAQFSAEMRRLQVDSIQLRARAQAMQARGDAYFENWHEHLARVKDPKLRAIAEEHRPALRESFSKIKSLSLEAREAFSPFLSSLRNVRNALEADPASLSASAVQNWIATARENGERVQGCLAQISLELESMAAIVNPKRGAKGQPKI